VAVGALCSQARDMPPWLGKPICSLQDASPAKRWRLIILQGQFAFCGAGYWVQRWPLHGLNTPCTTVGGILPDGRHASKGKDGHYYEQKEAGPPSTGPPSTGPPPFQRLRTASSGLREPPLYLRPRVVACNEPVTNHLTLFTRPLQSMPFVVGSRAKCER
jgi:hypothetical protein